MTKTNYEAKIQWFNNDEDDHDHHGDHTNCNLGVEVIEGIEFELQEDNVFLFYALLVK